MSPDLGRRFEVSFSGDVTVAKFKDHGIVNERDIKLIAEQLQKLLGGGSVKLVLNFSEVRYLSSSMLGKLIALNQATQKAGGRLALCHILPKVYEVFEVTNLKKLFNIYVDEQAAVASF